MKKPASILLVDDHAMLRRMLGQRLDLEADLRVVAGVNNAGEAITEATRLKPDIIIMDIEMPGTTCFEAVRTIQACSPESRVIFLSAFSHDRYIEQAIAVRAWGYIVKSESEEVVIAAIRRVVSGLPYYSPEVEARLVVEDGAPRLTRTRAARSSALSERELGVLRYLARGLSQKEVAAAASVSIHTVHRHVTSIMKKLDIHNRADLVRYAIREGFVDA